MSEKVDILSYISKVRQASIDDDLQAVEKLEEKYGDIPATFKDVETANAYTIQILAANYETSRTLLNFEIDSLSTVLTKNGTIKQEDVERINADISEIIEQLNSDEPEEAKDDETHD